MRVWLIAAVLLAVSLLAVLSSRGVYSAAGQSMMPTLPRDQRFVVDKLAYGVSLYSLPFGVGRQAAPDNNLAVVWATPERGDIVLFRDPTNSSRMLVKRVIAIEGDRVAMVAGRLWLNGELISREARSSIQAVPSTPLTLPSSSLV